MGDPHGTCSGVSWMQKLRFSLPMSNPELVHSVSYFSIIFTSFGYRELSNEVQSAVNSEVLSLRQE